MANYEFTFMVSVPDAVTPELPVETFLTGFEDFCDKSGYVLDYIVGHFLESVYGTLVIKPEDIYPDFDPN